jgi:hypothetical protein
MYFKMGLQIDRDFLVLATWIPGKESTRIVEESILNVPPT